MFKNFLLAVAILAAPAFSFGQTCTTNITNNFGAAQTLGVGGTDTISLLEPLATPAPTETGTLTCPGVVLTSYSVVGGPQDIQIPFATSTFIGVAGGVETLKNGGTSFPIISDTIQLQTVFTGGLSSSITFTSDPLRCDASVFNCTLANEPSVIVHGLFGINGQPITFTFSGTSEFPLFLTASDTVTLDYAHAASVTPEPASILLFGTGLISMALMLRKGLLP